MSDVTYQTFQHYGTTAERAAFTPNPAAGIKPIYIWYETDTGLTYLYHTAWVQITGSTLPPPTEGGTPNTFLVSGGQVIWESAYTFRVSAASYYINGVPYTSAEQTVTLTAADATNDRIDAIVLNTSGVASAITGTAASTPSEPSIDPAQYLKLGLVFVEHATTAPPDIETISVYAENTGPTAEWTWATSHASLTLASTASPHAGTKSIEGTSVVAGEYVKGTVGTAIDPNDYDHLLMFIKSKAAWNNSRGLLVTLRAAGVLVGAAAQIRRSGTYGFDSTVTAGYQQVAVPITSFSVPLGTLIDEVRIEDFGGAIGFYIDDISLQANASEPVGGWLTQDQADALYAPLVHAPRHQAGGADPIKLDDLAAPDDNTDLNSSTLKHGLLPKLSGNASEGLKGDGTWGSVGGGTHAPSHSSGGSDPVTITNLAGFPGGSTDFLRADGTFAAPPAGGGGGGFGDVVDVRIVRKTADESVLSSTTMQDDNELFVSLAANSTYIIDFTIFYEAVITADLKIQLSGPSDLTGTFGGLRGSNTITSSEGNVRVSSGIFTAGVSSVLGIGGTAALAGFQAAALVNTITAGTLKLQWAQETSQSTATIIKANSYLVAYKLGVGGSVTRTGTIGLVIDGGSSVITTGFKTAVQVPFACTITGWTILSNDSAITSGSIVIDVWKDTYANYPPTVADTITASAKPTLSSATKATSTTLTGWTTSVTAGDIIGFNVDSVTSVMKITLTLQVTV